MRASGLSKSRAVVSMATDREGTTATLRTRERDQIAAGSWPGTMRFLADTGVISAPGLDNTTVTSAMVEPILDRLKALSMADAAASASPPTPKTPSTPSSDSAAPSEIDASEPTSHVISTAPSPGPGAAGAVPDDELERFRREWKEEVASKRPGTVDVGPVKWSTEAEPPKPAKPAPAPPSEAAGKGKAAAPSEPSSPVKLVRVVSPRSPVRSTVPRSPEKVTGIGLPARLAGQGLETAPAASSSGSGWSSGSKIPFRAPRVRRNSTAAVEVYTEAVQAEQQGRLNDALKLYRHAFKLDDNVDRAYQRVARAAAERDAVAQAQIGEEAATSADVVDPRGPAEEEYEFTRHIQLEADYARPLAPASRLTALIDRFAHAEATDPATGEPWAHVRANEFAPLDAELPLPIASLPAEILERILAQLDIAAVERFGSTCWRARVLTEHASKWHHLVKAVYRPPMVRDVTITDLHRKHRGEWRSVFVEEERLRMDGTYIAVCHYIRPGAGEEWVAVTHMSESSAGMTGEADRQSRTTASSGSTPTAPCFRSSRPTTRPTSCRSSSPTYGRRDCMLAAGASYVWMRTKTRVSPQARRPARPKL